MPGIWWRQAGNASGRGGCGGLLCIVNWGPAGLFSAKLGRYINKSFFVILASSWPDIQEFYMFTRTCCFNLDTMTFKLLFHHLYDHGLRTLNFDQIKFVLNNCRTRYLISHCRSLPYFIPSRHWDHKCNIYQNERTTTILFIWQLLLNFHIHIFKRSLDKNLKWKNTELNWSLIKHKT